jgi:hypothetical protein
MRVVFNFKYKVEADKLWQGLGKQLLRGIEQQTCKQFMSLIIECSRIIFCNDISRI